MSDKDADAYNVSAINDAMFRVATYDQCKWALNNFESRFSQTMNLTSLPLGSNKLSLQDEYGYPRVSTGDSPRQKMAPISGKFQPSNPNKQPCMYSTLPPLSQMQCFKSNSTSSIYSTTSIHSPKLSELTLAVSALVMVQLERDQNHLREGRSGILSVFNEENFTQQPVTEAVSQNVICKFIRGVFDVGQFHPECCVIMLIYLNRLISVTQLPVTPSNWKPLLITCLVVAQKVWDDTPLINSDFSILYPALTVHSVNALERVLLDVIEFKLAISTGLYAQYYFELRSVAEEVNRQTGKGGPLIDCGGNPAQRFTVPRMHYSECRNKKEWKKRVNVPELIHTTGKYNILF